MKLSTDTLSVLKNFSGINGNLEFKAGKVIKTISSTKTVMAKATLTDEFPQDFCVYDLNQFLSVYSMHKDSDIDFDDKNVIFKSGKSKTNYRKADKQNIITPPDKDLVLPSVDVSFTLTETDLTNLLKSASILQSQHIVVESDGEKVYITSCSIQQNGQRSENTNSIEVGDGNGNTYTATFLTENLKMIPGNYEVEVSSKGMASFKNTTQRWPIQYWIAIEAKHSKFA
jgi:DNA polymerase III sliding clamp (beta) subunit (PCNA family)